MVDHKIGRHLRVDRSRIATCGGNRIAKCGEVDQDRNAKQVLQEDTSGIEGQTGADAALNERLQFVRRRPAIGNLTHQVLK
jgi:hypothetical protein